MCLWFQQSFYIEENYILHQQPTILIDFLSRLPRVGFRHCRHRTSWGLMKLLPFFFASIGEKALGRSLMAAAALLPPRNTRLAAARRLEESLGSSLMWIVSASSSARIPALRWELLTWASAHITGQPCRILPRRAQERRYARDMLVPPWKWRRRLMIYIDFLILFISLIATRLFSCLYVII